MKEYKDKSISIGKEEAIRYYTSNKWGVLSSKERVKLQLYTKESLMPWEIFHRAVNECLGRGVMTHEFAKPELLQAEFEGKKSAMTVGESLKLAVELFNK